MYNFVDSEIRILIQELNYYGLETISSCAGHFRLCKGYLQNFDDNYLDEYHDHKRNNDKYCSFTSQPCMYFKLNDKTREFMENFGDKNLDFPYEARIYNDNVYICYGNGCEGYSSSCEPFAIYPQFELFWKHFLKIWKQINPQTVACIPKNHHNHKCNKCDQDNKTNQCKSIEMDLAHENDCDWYYRLY